MSVPAPQRATGFRSFAAICALFLASGGDSHLRAQAIYGSIVGTISDQSGAVVPKANIRATNVGTGQVRTDVTDVDGRFTVGSVLPGTYSVMVEAPGFKRFEQTNVTVTPNTVSRVEAALQIGQAAEQVTVSENATMLQTDKADTHTEITSKQVRDIPLGGQRSYQTLINLTPGATPGGFANSVLDNPGSPLRTNVNGAPAQTNTTRIDGASSVNLWLPQYPGFNASAETIDVVNVGTSALEADQGLAGASAITVVSKSGTNDLHGSAFLFHNNQHLNARNFFLSPSQQKPVGNYNNYGATLGGKIIRNKLFYFISFDGTNSKTSANYLATVPTLAQRNGDFRASANDIYDPTSGSKDTNGNLTGVNRTAFLNKTIPMNQISPIALKIQSYLPLPNLNGEVNNYTASGEPYVNRYTADSKVNWNRNEKHSIWGKYGRQWATTAGQGIFGVAGGTAPGSSPGMGDTTVNLITLGHTYTFSPNVILQGTVAYQRQNQSVTGADYGTNFGSTLGIPGLNGSEIRTSGFPNINFGSFYEATGVPNWMPLFRTDENYTHSDSVNWTKGAHSVAFGFDLVRFHLNHWQPELSDGGPRGYLRFNGQATTLANGAAANQYNAYAQFLLGLADQTQKGQQYILMTTREWQFGWFAQDRWQVSRNLTISAGLRYEYYPLITRAGKGIERYDPTTNNVLLGGRGNIPDNVGITTSKKLFAPRFGIAYRLGEKTVIRAGYGLNIDPLPFSRPLRGYYPLTINSVQNAANNYTYATTLGEGLPQVTGPDLSTGIVPLPAAAAERSPVAGELHRGYTQSYNFTIERRLPGDFVASAGFVRTNSTHLLADRDINSGGPGTTVQGLPFYKAVFNGQQLRRTTALNLWDGYLSSNYNSLQTSVNKQFSKGLLVKGAYTWSHAIDYTDEDGWASTNFNWGPVFQRNRATAGYDRTHVFQMAWVYELPAGKGKRYLNSGIAAQIAGGWQLSGVHSSYTGLPFTVTAPDNGLNAPNNIQTANQIAPVVQTGLVGSTGQYYSPASFSAPSGPIFGTTGRNILRGPGLWNTDLSIMRIFPIRERFQAQFRTEFYNLPNTSHFGGSSGGATTASGVNSTNITNANFARITSSNGERNIRFSLRLQW